MPGCWTTADVERHTKKPVSARRKRQWVHVANGVYSTCIKDGGSDKSCRATAVEQANGVVKKQVAKGREVKEKDTKKQSGRTHVRSDFLVQGEKGKPSTWHLPVRVRGKINRRLMGAAKAALTSNFRGQPYKGPNKGSALAKLRALYKQQGMKWEEADMAMFVCPECGEKAREAGKCPECGAEMKQEGNELQEIGRRLNKRQLAQLRAAQQTIETILGWAEYTDLEEPTEETFAETASGHIVELTEAFPVDSVVPLMMNAVLIEPGFGNKRDGHYYPPHILKRDAKVFEGVKMYETDHVQKDKSTRTWVSTVKEIVGFTSTGAPIGRVVVHEPSFAERLIALNEAEILDRMECSILATGVAKKGKVKGKRARIVESITEADSVDWVTRAGAGGRAQNLVESGGTMEPRDEDFEETEEEAEEVQISEDDETPDPLSEEAVTERLDETNLPGASKERLAVVEYFSEDALESAIDEEIAYVKEITRSGKPFRVGGKEPRRQPRTEEQCREDFDRILVEAGGQGVYGT